MSANIIQAQYDELENIARCFGRQADAQLALQQALKGRVASLRGGAWQGKGAGAFYSEMDGKIFPALTRLSKALNEAQKVTLQMSALIRQAEAEAAAPFNGRDRGEPFPEKTDGLDPDTEGQAPTEEERSLIDQLLDPKLPWWLDIGLSFFVIGDIMDLAREQVLKRLRGQEPDALITALAGFGLAADLGWLNPAPFAEDIPNGVLAVLKTLGKNLPKGATRDALAELVEKAVKNPDDMARLGKITGELAQHPELLEFLSTHPKLVRATLESGPEFVQVLAKYGDEGMKAAELLGKHAPEVLGKYDEIAHLPGAENVLRDLVAGNGTTVGAMGEIRYFSSIKDEVVEIGSVINGKKAADGILHDGTVVDVKNWNFNATTYQSPGVMQRKVSEVLDQVDLRHAQYPGQPIRYVFTSPLDQVPQALRDALIDAGVEVVGMP